MTRKFSRMLMRILDHEKAKSISEIHAELFEMGVEARMGSISIALTHLEAKNKVIRETNSNLRMVFRRRYKR